MRTMLEVFFVFLCQCLCLGKVHAVPALARKRILPGNVCRFNSPRPASFGREFKLRRKGPESPAMYLDSGGAGSSRTRAFIVRSVKLPGRQQGDVIMEWEDRLRKGGE